MLARRHSPGNRMGGNRVDILTRDELRTEVQGHRRPETAATEAEAQPLATQEVEAGSSLA